jgi:hypothetical protein
VGWGTEEIESEGGACTGEVDGTHHLKKKVVMVVMMVVGVVVVAMVVLWRGGRKRRVGVRVLRRYADILKRVAYVRLKC